ncbi:CDP-diacylglycerol--glycerol-3-phosphate 3-phosphatidyltransferase [Desulfomicrobium apsheronum]|uniref:CDP-diacylglycerol--glycerol-3-phosphate 3-phosphatidyltransferase n=2 Tax=Desulfomicrobium apsheronum TaxID=52560 RepID=A0A1I3YY88_9BACT|nr:CDP-diacylglycerol--glycerol-3-phosphate 3-phosphatidyltransferase [Desulfomicrobium apsheronum]
MSPVMTVYALKSKFQNMLRPACRFLADNGVTANQVTVSATILSAAAGSLVWLSAGARWTLAVLPCALFVRMAFNALDGMLAREHGMRSDVGAMLNELGDVVSDAALYLPLTVVPGCSAPLVVMAVVLGTLSEMVGILGVQFGGGRRYDGPMGKSDRAAAFGLLSLAFASGAPRETWPHAVMIGIVMLLVVTIFRRAGKALQGGAA